MGPGRTVGLRVAGMSVSINFSRADDSIASADKCANVGESWVAWSNVND